jgi:hypothetical protein
MIILPQDVSLSVPHHTLQKLMYDKALIKQLAIQIVAGQVEAHIEMGCDSPSEYGNHADAAAMIGDAKTTAEDYFADLVTEFRDAVYEAIRTVEVNVKSTTFSPEGLEDALVEVK